MALPQYETLTETIIPPFPPIPKGSIINQTAPPGPHLHPLNDEARAAFEEWYNEEMPELDARGMPTGGKIKPRLQYKMAALSEPIYETTEIVEGPPKETAPDWQQSMAAMGQHTQTAYTPPPPLKPRADRAAREGDTGLGAISDSGEATIISVAPESSKVKVTVKA